MRHNILIIASMLTLWSSQLFAASFTIGEQQLRDLRTQRAEIRAKVKELERISAQIDATQSEKKSAAASIKRLEAESKQAKNKLEKLQAFDRENPGDITPEQLRAAAERNKQAFRDLKEAQDKQIDADAKINNVLNVEADSNYADFQRLKSSFERDVNREVEVQLQERIRNIQISKEVTVTERISCGEDSIPVCKERSKKAAEQKASERGSVVFVQSLTEVKNYQLSKEDIRSEVQANLSDKVFSNQHIVGEADYETTLKAVVTPVISDTLRRQMADSLREEVYSMVGGKVENVKNPAYRQANVYKDEDEDALAAGSRKKPSTVIREEAQPQPAPQPQPAQQWQEPQPAYKPPVPRARPTPSF